MKKEGIIILLLSLMVFTACGSASEEFTSAQATNDCVSLESMMLEEKEMPAEEVDIDYSDKLIYTCNLYLETKQYDSTLQNIKELIGKSSGFIQSESTRVNNYYDDGSTRCCELTIRIPSQHYDDFLKEISDTGTVVNMNANVENITQQYYDTETRIKALRTQEDRLLEMMADCETVTDMITVEDRLSEVQAELAVYQTNLNIMKKDIDYSTVNISIDEVKEISIHSDSFGEILLSTLKKSWSFFIDVMGNIGIAIIYILPFSIIAGIILLIIRVICKNKVKKKQEKDNMLQK